jgi:hypothetical protein
MVTCTNPVIQSQFAVGEAVDCMEADGRWADGRANGDETPTGNPVGGAKPERGA